jgi:hypothetical protein
MISSTDGSRSRRNAERVWAIRSPWPARKHNGDTSDRPRITICTIEGCGGKVRTKGLCVKHYMRALRHDRNTSGRPLIVRTCSVEGCGGRVWGKGLCHKHCIRARKHNGDTSDRPRITICTIEGCGGKVCAKGFCRKHYEQARRPRIVRTCSVEGCGARSSRTACATSTTFGRGSTMAIPPTDLG